jgi:hypothetical protein
MSRLHNARKRLKALLGPMLALVLWLCASLVAGALTTADAQPMIRFGVRVLQASNVTKPDTPPGQGAQQPPPPAPQQGPPVASQTPPPPPLTQGQPPHGTSPFPLPPPNTSIAAGDDERLKPDAPQLQMVFRYSKHDARAARTAPWRGAAVRDSR